MFYTINICAFLIFMVSLNSVQSLTTFGKSPSNQNQPIPTPTARGKDCTMESECAGIQDTSCVPDPLDKKMRCLCGDNKAPQNGQCQAKIKGVGHSCNSDSECLEGGSCMINNATNGNNGNNGNNGGTSSKVCKCAEGAVEIGNMCSGGAPMVNIESPLIITTSLVVAMISILKLN
ncbi:uncharacterized protein LOC123302564 [Chrysoperla carnea]|uniref:uncharacterized protein LOC123302564 n=1 Tax=Chrysoperla carnea TaxID=189513 RepID=UPI001D0848A8|nr:uncharacterized protein LOC123302564 [Chrysoperla carnea]